MDEIIEKLARRNKRIKQLVVASKTSRETVQKIKKIVKSLILDLEKITKVNAIVDTWHNRNMKNCSSTAKEEALMDI